MPQGEGTYGSQVDRPSKQQKSTARKTISDRDRRRLEESMLRESGKNISDRDRKLIRQLKESGPNQRLAKGPGRRMDNQSAKTDSDVRYAAKGGSVSSTRAAFNKAFAAARKKHVAGDGPANFTYKGKRYNVQTKQDRKTTIGKAKARKAGVSGIAARNKSASQTFRKQMKEASRTKADKTPSYDFSNVTVPSSKELANQRKKQRLRRMAGSISPALVAAGGPGALLTRQGVKSLGGGKATVKTGKRIVDRLKQERKKRKGGYGYEQSYGEIVKKGVKGQRSSVKRKETLAEKEAKRQANLKKRRDAYKKRKKSRG